jgi:hypothetical protein
MAVTVTRTRHSQSISEARTQYHASIVSTTSLTLRFLIPHGPSAPPLEPKDRRTQQAYLSSRAPGTPSPISLHSGPPSRPVTRLADIRNTSFHQTGSWLAREWGVVVPLRTNLHSGVMGAGVVHRAWPATHAREGEDLLRAWRDLPDGLQLQWSWAENLHSSKSTQYNLSAS